MTLFTGDRELIAAWAEEGAVPDDHSTREYAAQLCARLLVDHDRAWELLTELTDGVAGQQLSFLEQGQA